MLATAMKLDLCQNVFVDGKWGTYKCAPLSSHLPSFTPCA